MIYRIFPKLYILLLCLLLPCPAALAQVFDVGPGHPHAHLRSIDWDGLKPGDEVRILARPEPYREKLIIRPSGTRKQPIIIRGISDKDGSKPVIDGENALSFQKTDVNLSRRALIIVDRSQAVTIRHNWIQGGMSLQIDLVERVDCIGFLANNASPLTPQPPYLTEHTPC